jgi:hypothetical protein
MLHEQGYDMDKVTELLTPPRSQRGLQDAIDKLHGGARALLSSVQTPSARPVVKLPEGQD